jgi:hypothetical protein
MVPVLEIKTVVVVIIFIIIKIRKKRRMRSRTKELFRAFRLEPKPMGHRMEVSIIIEYPMLQVSG